MRNVELLLVVSVMEEVVGLVVLTVTSANGTTFAASVMVENAVISIDPKAPKSYHVDPYIRIIHA